MPQHAPPLATPLSIGLRQVIDTAAEVSTVPPTHADLQRGTVGFTLQAFNSASIPTYDTRSLTQDLGLRCSFQWLFIIADVKKAILCADILQHYKLLVDVGNRRVMDTLTQLKVQGITSDEPVFSPTLLYRTPSNLYEAIQSDFPSLTKPYNKEQPVKHDVTHHIKTTGSPVSSRNCLQHDSNHLPTV